MSDPRREICVAQIAAETVLPVDPVEQIGKARPAEGAGGTAGRCLARR